MHRTIPIALASACLLVAASASAAPWDGHSRFAVGLRASSTSLSSSAHPDNVEHFGGAGVQIRYRLSPMWELEVAAEHQHAERAGGAYKRDWRPATLSALIHITPQGNWDWYLIAGLGAGRDDVAFRAKDGTVKQASFERSRVDLGGGVERRFGHIGVAAELRLIGTSRSDKQLDGPAYAGSDLPVPAESSGGQLTLLANYDF